MTIDTVQQGQALCQALALGALFGLLYDLFRILRVRVKLPVVGPAAGSGVLAGGHGDSVSLVPGGLGGTGPPVRGAVFCMGGEGSTSG